MLCLIVNVCFAKIKITMLNVGQGDSFLIETENHKVLVDTSDIDEREKLVSELDKAGVTILSELILTHPHADHIANAAFVIDKYAVNKVYDNGVVSTSKYFKNYLAQVQLEGIERSVLKRGDTLTFDDATIEVYHPADKKYSVNNGSIIFRLGYGDFAMLFTGDAELQALADILEFNIKSDILKASHHGAKNATLLNFVQKVNPAYVLISAGEPGVKGGNVYGHPHQNAIATFLYAGVKRENILWSWKNGTVIVESDGVSYTVKAEKKLDWVKGYVTDSAEVISARKLAD